MKVSIEEMEPRVPSEDSIYRCYEYKPKTGVEPTPNVVYYFETVDVEHNTFELVEVEGEELNPRNSRVNVARELLNRTNGKVVFDESEKVICKIQYGPAYS